jgi:hypothetical protein
LFENGGLGDLGGIWEGFGQEGFFGGFGRDLGRNWVNPFNIFIHIWEGFGQELGKYVKRIWAI